ncbi:uncharacterized protein LOC123548135 [Mercenaria mercenaria]|uniref:uncharacterized protein LOC123548135 n=1 Tax=Mercenaria mercenaria TaxID=6596 RepID=UPI00234F645F|nr:uncharacterized protein LOC123548135 [Mercenaria mercenaria]
MDMIQIPSFVLSSNGSLVTKRLLEFRKQCLLFADETAKGTDASGKIMKTLTEYPPIQGVPVLNNLLELLKDALFSYQAFKFKVTGKFNNEICGKVNPSGDSTDSIPALEEVIPRRKSYDTFLSWKALLACRRLHNDLLAACRDHQNVVYQLQETLQNYRVLNEKCAKVDEKLETIRGKNQYNRRQEKSQAAFDKLSALYEEEKIIREEKMKQIENKLRSIIETEIRETVVEGIKNLMKVAKSIHLPVEFTERLEKFDCYEVAEELFKDLSGKYFHPVIEKTNFDRTIAATAYVDPYFAEMEKHKQRFQKHDSYVCLLEEGNFDTRKEELYVWANASLADKNNTIQLKFKAGTKIKQKLCSTDGSLAFGWTRKFAYGAKKYGFYPTNATRLVP